MSNDIEACIKIISGYNYQHHPGNHLEIIITPHHHWGIKFSSSSRKSSGNQHQLHPIESGNLRGNHFWENIQD